MRTESIVFTGEKRPFRFYRAMGWLGYPAGYIGIATAGSFTGCVRPIEALAYPLLLPWAVYAIYALGHRYLSELKWQRIGFAFGIGGMLAPIAVPVLYHLFH